MAHADPGTVAQHWAERLGGSTDKIRQGVQRVTQAPGAKAAASANLWLARTQASVDKYRRNVGRVSLADWQQAMEQKGLARVASGASAAVPKMTQFLTEFLPYVDSGAQQVRSMPKGGIEQSIARAAAMIRHNANFRRGGGAARQL